VRLVWVKPVEQDDRRAVSVLEPEHRRSAFTLPNLDMTVDLQGVTQATTKPLDVSPAGR
jgi:hypothetical protein